MDTLVISQLLGEWGNFWRGRSVDILVDSDGNNYDHMMAVIKLDRFSGKRYYEVEKVSQF